MTLIYSGLVWHGEVWSHSHELAIHLSENKKIIYHEVPPVNDPNHPSIRKTKDGKFPKNIKVIQSVNEFDKFNLTYLLFTQIFMIRGIFHVRKKFKTIMIYNVYDWPVLILSKLLKKKIIFMYVDEYCELTPNFILKTYLKFNTWLFLKLSNHVVCTAHLLKSHADKYNKNVDYLPNCVNLEDENNLTKKTEEDFIIGFVGGLGSWVDIEMIMQTAKHFEEDETIKFWVIGSGERYNEFDELIRRHHVMNIELFGNIPHNKMYSHLSQFDIGIIPFKINKITNSVSPIKLFEYWLAKKPVITTKTYELESMPNIIYVNTYHDMIEEIKELYNRRDNIKKIGEAGYKLVKEKYNWENTMKRYEEILQNG